MEPSREISRTPPHQPPCSDVSVHQRTRMSQFWDTHHMCHNTMTFISFDSTSNVVRITLYLAFRLRCSYSARVYNTVATKKARTNTLEPH